MSISKTGIILALGLMVAGAAPALAGPNEDAMIRRLAPTESISSQASKAAPTAFTGAFASTTRVYRGRVKRMGRF